ncbi:MAG: molybdopterin-dependent oxidoreductase, partial [Opitutaceae bacterium]|nr:molybdopterin-dependent oxidoreductase [Opitutaceae bacterium]
KQTNSICTESSAGVNSVVWSREGTIYRITPRRNDEVNDTWMADSGRVLYKQVQSADRLKSDTALDALVAQAAAIFKASAGAISVVGSGRSSVEEQFVTKKLAAALGAQSHLVKRVGEGDKLLISADRNPNTRGALVTGLISQLPCAELKQLSGEIDSGKVKTVIAINEDLLAAGLTAAQLAKVSVIYLGTHANGTSAIAKVVIPTVSVFEKAGTFINQQFRIQKFIQAVPALAGANNDIAALAALSAAAGSPVPSEIGTLWPVIAAEVPALATMLYKNIPETGLLLDSTPWASLPFVEGETLHFKPAAPAAAVTV